MNLITEGRNYGWPIVEGRSRDDEQHRRPGRPGPHDDKILRIAV